MSYVYDVVEVRRTDAVADTVARARSTREKSKRGAGASFSTPDASTQMEDRTMRLDDYRCSDCGHVFEALTADTEKACCPKCKSEHTERQLGGFSIGGAASSSGLSTEVPSCASCGNGTCGL